MGKGGEGARGGRKKSDPASSNSNNETRVTVRSDSRKKGLTIINVCKKSQDEWRGGQQKQKMIPKTRKNEGPTKEKDRFSLTPGGGKSGGELINTKGAR